MLTLLIYLWLYMFPFPLTEMNLSSIEMDYYFRFIAWLNGLASKLLFGISGLHSKVQTEGTGDTRYDYSMLVTLPVLAGILAVVVWIFTRKSASYNGFYRLTVIYARYFVGLYLLLYSASKFMESQFPLPRFEDLERTYGDLSPMDLLWLFMGYAPAYCAFTAFGEFLGGFFLLFRRTIVIGGLITMAAMSNVVMLNYTYDVPVKLFSTHLFLIALFVISPNIRQLYGLFFLNQAAKMANPDPIIFREKWMRPTWLVLKTFLIVGAPILILHEEWVRKPDEAHLKTNGTYIVNQFERNGQRLPLEIGNSLVWRKMILENGEARIFKLNDSLALFKTKIDLTNQRLAFQSISNNPEQFILKFEQKSEKQFIMKGTYLGDSITVYFTRKSKSDYKLINRGFHWINEYPHYQIY